MLPTGGFLLLLIGKPLKFFLFKTMPTVILPLKEEGFHYNSLPIPPYVENISLIGYFQSYKYFEKHYETICRLIKLNEQRDKYSNETNKNANAFDYGFGLIEKMVFILRARPLICLHLQL